jgi:hypothetical protein
MKKYLQNISHLKTQLILIFYNIQKLIISPPTYALYQETTGEYAPQKEEVIGKKKEVLKYRNRRYRRQRKFSEVSERMV